MFLVSIKGFCNRISIKRICLKGSATLMGALLYDMVRVSMKRALLRYELKILCCVFTSIIQLYNYNYYYNNYFLLPVTSMETSHIGNENL